MNTSPLSLAGLLLAAGTLLSCERRCEPAPQCISGIIVGATCVDGLLVDVDPRYRIGQPALKAREQQPDSVLGQNVIAVVNSGEFDHLLGARQAGRRIYFTFENNPDRQWSGLHCFANDGVKNPVPRLVLHNVSTEGCGGVPASR